jgi:putative ABC transport system permease protein
MSFATKLRSLFRKGKLDAEMTEEMRHHVELQTELNLKAGMSAEDARFAALRQFGNVALIQEQAREGRGWVWLEQSAQDLRYAVWALFRSPGFAMAVVAMLAVAIGLVTAVVNVARPVLLPELPFPDPERLVVLRERRPETADGSYPLLGFRFTDYAKHSNSFTALGAETSESLNLVVGGEPYAVRVSSVTEGFFAALAVGCEQGRSFLPEDFTPARAGDTVVLSNVAWEKYFGRDPALLGQEIQVGDRLRQVIGILPPGFRTSQIFPVRSEGDGIYLATPYEAAPPVLNRTSAVNAVGRLKPGVTCAQAEAELTAIHPVMPPQSGELYKTLLPYLRSAADTFRESRVVPFRIFLAAAGLLYLIGCTAVANLMLSRAVARRRELGVRLALGGSRRRIMALLLTEALVLGGLGGIGGALIALWARGAMTGLTPVGMSADELLGHMMTGRLFALALGLGLLTCVTCALMPAWRAGRANLNEAMKEGAGTQGDSRRVGFLRGVFVVIQGALAVVLLIGAGLLLKTVYRLQHIDLGFVSEQRVAVMGYRKQAPDRERVEEINRLILERVASVPGIAAAALTTTVPAVGAATMAGVQIAGPGAPETAACYVFGITPDYFATMGIPLLAGRGFDGLHRGDRPVVIIDEIMARQYFPRQNPVGRFLTMGKDQLEIVGVVRRVAVAYRGGALASTAFTKAGSTASPTGNRVSAQIYIPLWQRRLGPTVTLIVRLNDEMPSGLGAALRRAVFEVDPTVVLTIQPLDEVVGGWSRQERQTLGMLQVLAGLALGLAAFGMFSVMAYAVAQRRGEFGVRLVLGATPAGLTAFVIRRGLQLGGLGILGGLAVAAALGRFLQSMLFETSPHEPLVYLVVTGLLLTVTLLACWLPARRAAKVDPMIALRAE